MVKILNWATTPGAGDFCFGLNCANNWSYENNRPILLRLHWWHGKDHLHHPEDPETIIERCDFYKSHLLPNDLVEVEHVIDSNETQYKIKKFDWFNPRSHKTTNWWTFKDSKLPVIEKKVVVWRATFLSETPRYWKRIITNEEWNNVIATLKDQGYDVVELTYRNPISEVYYHIKTCDFLVAYDGMWHYIARNFFKPMLVASHDGITRFHTIQAVPCARKSFLLYANNIDLAQDVKNKGKFITPYDYIHKKADRLKNDFWEWYEFGTGMNYENR